MDKVAAVARWIGLQLAAQAFKLVLGLPVVAATIGGTIAWLQGLPFSSIVLFTVSAIALVSIVLNLLWAFSAAFSLDGIVNVAGVQIEGARSRVTGQGGYGIIVWFKSDANFALEYAVDSVAAHLERNAALPEQTLATSYKILPFGNNGMGIGIAQMAMTPNATLHGQLDIEFRYGRPGKLKIKKRQRHRLWAETDDSGDVREARLYSDDRA